MKQYFQAVVYAACILILASCATTSKETKIGDAYLSAGVQNLYDGKSTEALNDLLNASKYSPKNPMVWNNLGLAYATKEEYAKAKECWLKALDLDSGFSDARANLGALYLKEGKLVAAEKELKLILKDLTYTKSFQVYYNLGLVYLQQGKKVAAEQQLKLATQNNQNFCPAWLKLGEIYKLRDELPEALAAYKHGTTGTCYNNPSAQFAFADVYLKQRNYTMAKNKYLEIIELFPESEWARKAEANLNLIR